MSVVLRAAFEQRLSSWASAQSPPIPIAYENVSFVKPTSGMYLECFLMPNVTMSRDVAASKERQLGMFQVNCWGPQGVGMGVLTTLAENVKSLFPVVPKIGLASIEQPPHVGSSLNDQDGWKIIPVTIKYRYET